MRGSLLSSGIEITFWFRVKSVKSRGGMMTGRLTASIGEDLGPCHVVGISQDMADNGLIDLGVSTSVWKKPSEISSR